MAAAVTQPLTLGEILDRMIQLYRRNFLLFLGIALAPAALYVLVFGGFSLYFAAHAAQLQAPASPQLVLTFFGVFAGLLLIGTPLLLATSAIALGALNFAAFHRNSSEPVTIRASYAHAFSHFWRYLGIFALQLLFAALIPGAVFSGILVVGSVTAGLMAATGGNPAFAALIGIVFFLLIVALFVVVVMIWLRLSLAFPASLVEGLKVWPSIQRSNRLTKGSRGRIFVMYLLVGILAIVAYYALAVPLDIVLGLTLYKSSQLSLLLVKPPLALRVINLFIGFLQRAFAMPVYAIGLLFFYTDQRTRLEGYDIELLMAHAGWATTLPPQPEAEPLDPALAMYPAGASPFPSWSVSSPALPPVPDPQQPPTDSAREPDAHPPEASGA